MIFDYPRRPEGEPRADLDRMWEDLWHIVEQLRLLEEQTAAGAASAKGATGSTAPAVIRRETGFRSGRVTATTSPDKDATVDGVTELKEGTACYIVNDGTASASGFTLNVNGLGKKNVYNSMSGAAITTQFAANAGYLFVYNTARNNGGGGWDMQMGYDSNTNTLAYQIRTERTSRPLTDRLSRYLFCFSQADGTLVPCYTVSSGNGTTATTKTMNTSRAFDPRMPIFYYAGTTNVPNTGQPGGSALFRAYHACEMRYAWNTGTTLQAVKPCYVRCSPNTDGTVQLDGNDCLVQDLPTTADGKVYIYLGQAYGSTGYNMELDLEHPCFEYSNGAVRPWNG